MEPHLLDILICTHGDDGLHKVCDMQLPRIDGVRYVVSCQSEPYEVPAELLREDVSVHFNDTKGLSNNRNASLDLATAPYALIADNDLRYIPEGVGRIAEAFEKNPDVDIATFRHIGPDATIYPEAECEITMARSRYNFVSVEIALRMSSVRRAGVHFSPLMGIGAPYLLAGEEALFVHHCMSNGLRARFFPVDICRHDHLSTGHNQNRAAGALRSSAALMLIRFPMLSPFLVVVGAYRTLMAPFFPALKWLVQGWWYALHHRKDFKQQNC